jgi:hypothetical protein
MTERLLVFWLSMVTVMICAWVLKDTPIAPLLWMSVGGLGTLMYMDRASRRLHQSVMDLMDHVQRVEHERKNPP